MPHTGAFVGEALGLRCGSFDVNAACAGFVYELVVGASMVQMGYEHVLIVGAETLSRIVDPEDRTHRRPLRRRRGRRGARPPTRETPGLLAWDLGCDGSAAGLLEIPAGGSRMPDVRRDGRRPRALPEDGGPGGVPARRARGRRLGNAHARSAPASTSPTSRGSCRTRRTSASSKPPRSRLGFPPERTLVNIERYGNTSSASIPLALFEAVDDGRVRDGDLVLCAGFGAGMTWAQRAGPLGARMSQTDPAERVAFVTGGSRGIGRATVLALARAGHPVGFCYSLRRRRRATRRAQRSKHAGGKAVAVRADVADADAVDAAFGEIESAFGPVTVLVNNAGITRDGLLVRMSDEQWGAVIDTNLTGAFHTIRRATPGDDEGALRAHRQRRRRSARHIGQAGQANYAAAKAGLVGLTRSVARELARRNITCNVVAPGPIVTAMTDEHARRVARRRSRPRCRSGGSEPPKNARRSSHSCARKPPAT